MADDRKHIDDLDRPLAASHPDDTTVVMDEFVAPQDVVGEELADELQRVLDEAQGNLNEADAPTVAAAETNDPAANMSEDDGVFESPDEVISAEGAPKHNQMTDATIAGADVTRQLEAMNALIQQAVNQQPTAPAPDAPQAAVSAAEYEAQNEFEAPSDLGIAGALSPDAAPAESSAPSAGPGTDDELDMLEQIRQMSGQSKAAAESAVVEPMSGASSAKPAGPSKIAAAPQTLSQLDEVLAAQADHAVADEFETVHDVLAVQQATDDAAKNAAAPVVAAVETTGATPQTTAPVAPPAAAPAVAESPAVSPVPLPSTPAAATPAGAAALAPAAPVAPPAASQRRGLAALVQRARRSCSAGLYRACVVVSAPTRRTSDTTRNIIGYAGLITLGNALLLLVGKLVFG